MPREPQVLLDGLAFGESPRWHEGRLWLCNWGTGEIVAVDLDGRSEVVARVPPRTLPFSIDWLPGGELVAVDGPERRLVRFDADGSLVSHADLSGISEFGFNELVVDPDGNAYVNGIGFDMMGGAEPAPGLVVRVGPDGSARQVASGVLFPNGMAMTPEGSTLLVADSYSRRLMAFSIESDSGLGEGRVWAELGDGVPDGICLDAEGAAWYADVPNKRCVRVREGGEVLDTVTVDRGCFACMLGGPDGSTLFILAAEWRGPAAMFAPERTGRLLTVAAPAPRAGRP